MKKFAFTLTMLSMLLWLGCSKENLSTKSTGGAEMFDSYSGVAGSSGSSSGSGDSTVNVPAGQITAGEWNDLDNWDFWKNLHNNDTIAGYQDYWQIFPKKRYSVLVKNFFGKPVADCQVQLKGTGGGVVWEARTDNFGRAELWANLYNDGSDASLIFVTDGSDFVALQNPVEYGFGINQVTLNSQAFPLNAVDVAFIVDATGSMGDEITYLQAELTDVLNRIKSFNNNLNLRAGSVFYRDLGDDYVTKISPLTGNFSQTQSFVNNNHAGGGGDFPEAVDQALDVAVNNLEWSANARARIAFLILDAPPHQDESAVILRLQRAIREAAKKGVKIIPVTASGINKETEFLMRYCALATNGTYVFITNHSGIGNTHIEPTVGEYEVEFLNDLMVRLVKKYVSE
jgi:hypothetical protein